VLFRLYKEEITMNEKTHSQAILRTEILYNDIISGYMLSSAVNSMTVSAVILAIPGFFELMLLLLHISTHLFDYIFLLFAFCVILTYVFIASVGMSHHKFYMSEIIWKVKITNDGFMLVYGDDKTKEILFSNVKGFSWLLGICECEMIDGTRFPLNKVHKKIIDEMVKALEKWKSNSKSETAGWLYNDLISEYVMPAVLLPLLLTVVLSATPLLWDIGALLLDFPLAFNNIYLTLTLLIVAITTIFVVPILVRRKYDMSKIIWKVNLTDESCIIVYGDEKTKEIPFSSVKGFKSHPWSVDWEIFMTDGTKFTLLGINKRIMARIVDAFEKWKIRRSVH
jgi:hypothetical protein